MANDLTAIPQTGASSDARGATDIVYISDPHQENVQQSPTSDRMLFKSFI